MAQRGSSNLHDPWALPAVSGRHSGSSADNATNYAVGAARAYEDGLNVNLSAQVEAFLAAVRRRRPRPMACTRSKWAAMTSAMRWSGVPDRERCHSPGGKHLDRQQHRSTLRGGRENLHRLAGARTSD